MARISNIVNDVYDIDVDSWLDIGSGDGSVVSGIKFKDASVKVAIDPTYPRPTNHDSTWIKCVELDVAVDKFIKPISLITMFDVIEHIPKKDGKKLIVYLQSVSNNIILFTPDGFLKQDATTHPEFKGTPSMNHVCGYSSKELQDLGFTVRTLDKFHYPKGHSKPFNALLGHWTHD